MLKALLASSAVAALAEPLKAEYRDPTEAELAANPALKDHMILDVGAEGGYGLDNVDALKKTLGTEKKRADDAEKSLKAFEGVPADAKAKLAKLEELEKLDPDKEADKIAQAKFDSMKADLVKAHDDEMSPLKERASLLFTELDKSRRQEAATKAIVDAGGNPDVLLPHVLGHTKFVEKDGQFSVQVIDPASGAPRVADAHGNGMSLVQLVDEFKGKDAFAPLFSASGKSGGGGQPGTGPASQLPGNVRSKADLDLNSKAEYIEKHGMEAYVALPATAS